MRRGLLILICAFFVTQAVAEEGDIVFVTQVPNPADFGTMNATFGNHLGSIYSAPRGGDLWMRYADGTLRNLTKDAGYGQEGQQGALSIAVRDPVVHWGGQKVMFSMVIGAATKQFEVLEYRWQLYEIDNLAKNQTPRITKVPNQPAQYNNVMPAYLSDDTIAFVCDRSRNGETHLYPQHDEYESAPINTGIWHLNPATGSLALFDHSPSGDFHPTVDSFGRIIFTRWDHLQRDQQVDAGGYGTFDYSSEASDSVATNLEIDVFPEARDVDDPDRIAHEELHTVNQFFPWMMNQDGTDNETINHVGRQEFSNFLDRSRNDDPNLTYTGGGGGVRNFSDMFFFLREHPTVPGRYYAINAPEFATHAAGQVISIDAAPTVNPDDMTVTYVTHPDTRSTATNPGPNHTGLYRNPLPLKSGKLVASHTSNTREDSNIGTSASPQSRFAFRLKELTKVGAYFQPGTALTSGIFESVSYWSPDALITRSNIEMWELQPVEFVATTRPPATKFHLPAVETKMLADQGVDLAELRNFLLTKDLALIISRNVTSRDAGDKQQPFNLQIPGTTTKTIGATGKLYDISLFQIFQGDLIRGIGGQSNPRKGRRPMARPMHDLPVQNPASGSDIAGTVALGDDGSLAAFVPARRALSWQLLSPTGEAIVRERYWLTFQPGEVRVCASCHGVNSFDQSGQIAPVNEPAALTQLLNVYKGLPPGDKPTPRPTSTPTPSASVTPAGTPSAETPAFTVRFTKKGKAITQLGIGGSAQLEVSGSNSSTKEFSLRITIGSCTQSMAFTGSGTGTDSFQVKIPPTAKKGKVKAEVLYNGAVVGTQTASVTGKKRAGKMKCTGLVKALRR